MVEASKARRKVQNEDPLLPDPSASLASAEFVERGAFLARAGNGAACHTARGGAAFAGGRGVDTPFRHGLRRQPDTRPRHRPAPLNRSRVPACTASRPFAPRPAALPGIPLMPAFDLPHADLAALTTWLRGAWTHDPAPLTEADVPRLR